MKRKISVLIGIWLMWLGSLEAKIPVPQEQKIRLTEGWQFLRQDIGNIWEAVRPVKKGQPEEQPLWMEVRLPHCFNAEDGVDPDVNYYQGPGWYKTLLDSAILSDKGRIFLEFEGAGPKTEVYLYTMKVGSHVGGYDSWNVDITEAVHTFWESGEAERFGGYIPLAIRCDNSRDAEMLPSDLSDFNLYGGLYRYVNLVCLPDLSLSALRITPQLSEDGKKALLTVKGEFYNPLDLRSAEIRVSIKDRTGRAVANRTFSDVTPLGEQLLLQTTLMAPEVWNVDLPVLYTCEVVVTSGEQSAVAVERFGFRRFEFVEKGPFLLNGKRLLLRGTHRHEDHAGVGSAMTEEQMAYEMKLMKEMGVNFIRLGHYQQSEIILNLCDELGILVWEEIPWCRGGVGGERYRTQGKCMLSNMISQHYNHPSVIIWGLGNENDWPNDFPCFNEGEVRAFMSELNTLAHRLDSSRKTAIRRCGFCNDIPDVYSPSIWAGWYKGQYTEYEKYSRGEMEKVKHFLHVEWGGDSHSGRYVEDREPTKKDWSENYIAKLIDWHLKEQENMPWLTGTAFWPFKDFSTPIRPDNPIPYINQKGALERDFTKKEAYYVFQSYWSDKPMVHIFGHNWTTRWGNRGEQKEIWVYSNCREVELFVNGVSQGIRRRDSQDFPAAGLRWQVVLAEGTNEVRAVSTGKTSVEDTIRFDYQATKWGIEASLQVKVEDITPDTALVRVQIVDAASIPCLDSRRVIRFELVGEGKLIQNLGTVGGSRKVEASNGKASIKVRKGTGKSVVAVKSEGLETQFVMIE